MTSSALCPSSQHVLILDNLQMKKREEWERKKLQAEKGEAPGAQVVIEEAGRNEEAGADAEENSAAAEGKGRETSGSEAAEGPNSAAGGENGTEKEHPSLHRVGTVDDTGAFKVKQRRDGSTYAVVTKPKAKEDDEKSVASSAGAVHAKVIEQRRDNSAQGKRMSVGLAQLAHGRQPRDCFFEKGDQRIKN